MNTARSRDLFERLVAETDESAAVRLFVELCRASPALRAWLWEEFASNEATRAACAQLLDSDGPAPARFAVLSGDHSFRDAEARRLRAELGAASYGGLSFAALKELLVRHQAGKVEPAAFLFALQWRRRKGRSGLAILLSGALDIIGHAMQQDGAGFFRHLDRAATLADAFTNRTQRRAAVGYADWWKLHALLFMLRHPAPAYRTRDLCAHLATLGLRVSARDVRRFCTQHGIRRDMRAGRPGKPRAKPRRAAATRTPALPRAAGR